MEVKKATAMLEDAMYKEIDAIYECYKAEECEDGSIGYGWQYIYDATEEAMPIDEEEEDE